MYFLAPCVVAEGFAPSGEPSLHVALHGGWLGYTHAGVGPCEEVVHAAAAVPLPSASLQAFESGLHTALLWVFHIVLLPLPHLHSCDSLARSA